MTCKSFSKPAFWLDFSLLALFLMILLHHKILWDLPINQTILKKTVKGGLQPRLISPERKHLRRTIIPQNVTQVVPFQEIVTKLSDLECAPSPQFWAPGPWTTINWTSLQKGHQRNILQNNFEGTWFCFLNS